MGVSSHVFEQLIFKEQIKKPLGSFKEALLLRVLFIFFFLRVKLTMIAFKQQAHF